MKPVWWIRKEKKINFTEYGKCDPYDDITSFIIGNTQIFPKYHKKPHWFIDEPYPNQREM